MSVILATWEVEITRIAVKPAMANSSRDPISKMLTTKRAGRAAQGVGPEFKTQYSKNKKTLCTLCT
jgi:hypothetical protein